MTDRPGRAYSWQPRDSAAEPDRDQTTDRSGEQPLACYAPPTGRWGLGASGWFMLVLVGTVIATAGLVGAFVIVWPEAFTDSGADTGIDGSTAAGSWLLT